MDQSNAASRTFQEVLRKKPSGPLYHYTTQPGLLGITNAREIWATQVRYLNDASEFQHAVSIAEDIATGMVEKAPYTTRGYAERLLKGVQETAGVNICVASFSEVGDDLSQWRAYGKGSGYSLGFSHAHLSGVAESAGWILAPCIYEDSEQRSLLRSLLEATLIENASPRAGRTAVEDALQYVGGNISSYLTRYAAI